MNLEVGSNKQPGSEILLDKNMWHAIERGKHDFLELGMDPRQLPYLRPQVASSWIRSHRIGIDPLKTMLCSHLSPEDSREILEKYNWLVEIAHPLLQTFHNLHFLPGHALELIAPSGFTLDLAGKIDLRMFVERESIFNEKTMGTNAHSLCIMYKSPFQIIGPEHYCYALHGVAASAAPILDENGVPVASLLLTHPLPDKPWTEHYPKLLLHTMGTVATLAAVISHQIKFHKMKHSVIISQQTHNVLQTMIRSTAENVIVVDNSGIIVQISPKAGQLVGVCPESAIGQRFNELCNIQWHDGIKNPYNTNEKISIEIGGKLYVLHINPLSGGEGKKADGAILRIDEHESYKKRTEKSPKVGDVATIAFDDILGSSEAIAGAIKRAKQFAVSNENILLVGESGTGKEYFAQAIHNYACPPGRPFMSVNCAAIPPRLIESELFGYEGGSFTGAERNGRPGKIELADGGTLFLDEIGDMPLELQAVLLRVLENKRVIRLGGKQYKQINFRLITATNKDLAAMIQEGVFRKDLYYRLSVLTVQLPPLRSRKEDKVFFARHFLHECMQKNSRVRGHGKLTPELSPEVINFIESYPWPGNVRQLKNAIFSAYHSAAGGVITPADLPFSITAEESFVKTAIHGSVGGNGERMPEVLSLSELEKSAIKLALLHSHNSVARAAELLEISKATLYRKLKEYNLSGN